MPTSAIHHTWLILSIFFWVRAALRPAPPRESMPYGLLARFYDDVARYRTELVRFRSGEIDAAAFRDCRVRMGVYEHRQTGHYMVRVRLSAGLASPEQLERIAELSTKHGDGILHITTRQDIQIHGVSLGGTVAVQEGLLESGLTACGAGGNTVRNVTACLRAEVCPKAVFDVAPYAQATAEYLLQIPASYDLPRKYKIAFSGCGRDCAFASVNDLGFFAHEKAGRAGFSIHAGGGLGAQATAAVLIEEFVLPEEIFVVAEAVEQLFHRLGDRAHRKQARLRYVLRRLGEKAFVAEYRKQRESIEREGLSAAAPAVPSATAAAEATTPTLPLGFLAERDAGRLTLEVQLKGGRIPAADLVKVARIARNLGTGRVGTTQQQDILVFGIPRNRVADARTALAMLSWGGYARRPKVVACAGASTCKLGLCLSSSLADAIAERLDKEDLGTGGYETIRVSGCPNACANHPIALLGFEGRARRHGGRMMPVYEVLAGGRQSEGDVRFAERLGAVPARVVPDLVAEIYRRQLASADAIRPLVEGFARCPDAVPDDFYVER